LGRLGNFDKIASCKVIDIAQPRQHQGHSAACASRRLAFAAKISQISQVDFDGTGITSGLLKDELMSSRPAFGGNQAGRNHE
jgi:hypothetical protein